MAVSHQHSNHTTPLYAKFFFQLLRVFIGKLKLTVLLIAQAEFGFLIWRGKNDPPLSQLIPATPILSAPLMILLLSCAQV